MTSANFCIRAAGSGGSHHSQRRFASAAQACLGAAQRLRMPRVRGAVGDRAERFAVGDGDEKHARPRLRHESRRVDDERAEAVIRPPPEPRRWRRNPRRDARSGSRRRSPARPRAARGLRRRSSRISRQNGQNVPERVGALSRSPPRPRWPPASERSWQGNEAQARSTLPPGRSSGRQRRDVGAADMLRAPVGLVGRDLHRVEIVGEKAAPARPEAGARHAAAGEELVEGERRHPAPVSARSDRAGDA